MKFDWVSIGLWGYRKDSFLEYMKDKLNWADYYGFIDNKSEYKDFDFFDQLVEWGFKDYIVHVGDPASNSVHEGIDDSKLQLIIIKHVPSDVLEKLACSN
jgi:inhibitor of KinA sporulation pathway (predicted exonuclease)